MHRIEMGHFKYEGYTLAYEQHGPESGVPVLLMHGLLLDAAVNRDLSGPLVDAGCRVILLDLLGHGRSDKAEAADLRNDFFAEQAVACLDHLKIEQAVVGGLSLGAIVALHVAVQAPKRVRALLLEMPVMEHSTVFAALLLGPLVVLTDYAAWIYRPFARFMRALPRPRNNLWESVLNAVAQDPNAIRAVLHGVLVGAVVPSRRARRRIQAPALVIGHSGDWLHDMEDARALAEELPNGRLVVARSIFELRTKPERLMSEILSFLREVTGDKVTRLPTASAPMPEPGLVKQFEAAVEKVRNAPADGPFKPSNELKLKMYALYRQSRDGDVQGRRPGIMDVVGRYKYDACAALIGMPREEAMRQYIVEVEGVQQKYA
jgi:pimeloyl-ACP methyl ester carboxylesterase/acyl-CoA-binding protein